MSIQIETDFLKAVQMCSVIYSHCEVAPESARPFAENVILRTRGIEKWIKQTHHVTDGQLTALFNMYVKVKHWKKKNGQDQK